MRWMNFLMGVLVLLMGALPFIQGVIPAPLKSIPSSGNGYSMIIIILGVILVLNAYRQKGNLRLR